MPKAQVMLGSATKSERKGKVRAAPVTILGLSGCRDITAVLGLHHHPQPWPERQRDQNPCAHGGDSAGLHICGAAKMLRLPQPYQCFPRTHRDYSAQSAVSWVRAKCWVRTHIIWARPVSVATRNTESQMWCSGVDLLGQLGEIKSSC